MIQKKKICKGCHTEHYIFSHGLCRKCWAKSKEVITHKELSSIKDRYKANKANTAHTKPLKSSDSKSISQLLKLAQIVFNKFIRERDKIGNSFTCISCVKVLPSSQMQAGHYYPISTASSLRFDEDNCCGECVTCNCFDGSHQKWYRENLIKKIGKERVERLDNLAHQEKKWSREELLEIIKKYKK